MNWDAVGAVGEVFGAIAVFVTLAYLAVQVGQAREESLRLTSQSRSDSLRQSMATMATDARLLGATARAEAAMGAFRHPFVTALIEQSGLGEEDARVLLYWNMSMFQVFAQMIRSIEDPPPGEPIGGELNLRYYFSMHPVGRLYYQSTRAIAAPDIVRYLDNLLAQSG
jgi:hypothetical protein